MPTPYFQNFYPYLNKIAKALVTYHKTDSQCENQCRNRSAFHNRNNSLTGTILETESLLDLTVKITVIFFQPKQVQQLQIKLIH